MFIFVYENSYYLKREIIINDIVPRQPYIIQADTRFFNPQKPVDLILCHPPYYNIVRFSDLEADGSNQKSLRDFVLWFYEVASNLDRYLKNDKFIVLACGNIYLNSEEVELGEILKNIFLMMGYTLKSHIVKDYGETKGSVKKNYHMNYYRQLKGNFNNFYGDNIFLLQKRKSKNNIFDIYRALLKVDR